MLKVAYLSVLPPPGEPASSGVYKVSETLLREYETMDGVEVHAVALVDGLPQKITQTRGSVTYHYHPCATKGKTATLYLREISRLKRIVRSLGVSVVHGQPTSEYLLAATGCGLPSVITIHGLVLRELASYSKLSGVFWANWIREMLQRRAARRARHIISISPYVEEYLAGRTNARISPISNPIDPEFFGVPRLDEAGLRILCVGIVSARKNQLLLVRACALLEEKGIPFSCRIVGRIDQASAGDLEQVVRDLKLSHRVRICGMVSREEMLESYHWASAVVLPSREETAPLSLIQAMAAGRCVFGANAAGIPALLEQGKWGELFDGEKPEDLAQRLARMAENSGTFWERAFEAGQMAQARFKPQAVARVTLELYRRIVRPS
jgi:glycosyltransferase involved in cell wall biosynthesis